MNKRSTKLVLAGAAVLTIGCTLAVVGIAGADDDVPARVEPAIVAQDAPTSRVTEDVTSDAPGANAKKNAKEPVTVTVEPVKDGALPVVTLPDGLDGVAITVGGPAGLLSYAKPGDLIDVYATVTSAPRHNPPLVKRVVPHAQVVDVRPVGADTTYLLAVERGDVERIIFFSKFESVWLVLSGSENPARGAARRYGDVL